jgi:hypothetical protein
MRTVYLIAVNVFKESVRDKVLYNLVVFAVLLISISYLLGQLTATGPQDHQGPWPVVDLDLRTADRDFHRHRTGLEGGREAQHLRALSKPMRRSELVLGKYCGLVLTLAINVAVMTIALYAVLAYIGWIADPSAVLASPAPPTDPAMMKAIVLIMMELMLVTAIALFFSTFSSPFLSAMLTVGLWVIGHFNEDLRNVGSVVGSPVAAGVGRALYYVLPNFSAFDIKAQVVHGQPVSLGYVGLTTLYGLTYLAFLLVAAVTIFSRRDFK